MSKAEYYYTSAEIAAIIDVTDKKIQSWCEKGKYPGAKKIAGGHWLIPKEYFRITLEDARKRKAFDEELNNFNAQYRDSYKE